MDQPIEQPEQQPVMPTIASDEVEDIFAQTASSPTPLATATKPVPASLPPIQPEPVIGDVQNIPPTRDSRPGQRRMGRGTRMRLIVLAAVVVVSLVVLGIAYYMQNRVDNTVVDEITTDVENIDTIVPVETPVLNPVTPVITEPIIDSDGDGLLDKDEIRFGTDPKMSDTDLDGLTDRQEVQIHMTDPLQKDTDGDSFSDGEEVRNFFNPNGPGKLLDIVEEINKFEAEEAQ